MKIKDLHQDVERYLNHDCYCPHEVYSFDGFGYQLFYEDQECEKLGENKNGNNSIIGCVAYPYNDEKIKPQIAVTATIITPNGETIPALTAASPKTKAPTMLIEAPIIAGMRISLSRRISKAIDKIITSATVEKGTPSRCIAKLRSRESGITSALKVIMATYKAGTIIVKIKAVILRILVKLAFTLFS